MKNNIIKSALAAAALLLSTSIAFAVDNTIKTPDVKGAVKSSAESAKKGAKTTTDATRENAKGVATDAKGASKAKIVDINNAGEAELKAIPGIGDAYAAKIIAGRPYANKAQLKSRNILPAPAYEKVRDLIIAKQPKK